MVPVVATIDTSKCPCGGNNERFEGITGGTKWAKLTCKICKKVTWDNTVK